MAGLSATVDIPITPPAGMRIFGMNLTPKAIERYSTTWCVMAGARRPSSPQRNMWQCGRWLISRTFRISHRRGAKSRANTLWKIQLKMIASRTNAPVVLWPICSAAGWTVGKLPILQSRGRKHTNKFRASSCITVKSKSVSGTANIWFGMMRRATISATTLRPLPTGLFFPICRTTRSARREAASLNRLVRSALSESPKINSDSS